MARELSHDDEAPQGRMNRLCFSLLLLLFLLLKTRSEEMRGRKKGFSSSGCSVLVEDDCDKICDGGWKERPYAWNPVG
jgi:hypothetical protein